MFDADELAGMADLFGGLDRAGLEQACAETAFRRGEDLDEEAVGAAIDAAIEGYALVAHDGLLVPGPSAFPELPDGAADLPHIMDHSRSALDREAVAKSVANRFRSDCYDAIQATDRERCAVLLDLSYEIESWGPVSLDSARDQLAEVVAE